MSNTTKLRTKLSDVICAYMAEARAQGATQRETEDGVIAVLEVLKHHILSVDSIPCVVHGDGVKILGRTLLINIEDLDLSPRSANCFLLHAIAGGYDRA